MIEGLDNWGWWVGWVIPLELNVLSSYSDVHDIQMLSCWVLGCTSGQWGFLLKSSSVLNIDSADGDLDEKNMKMVDLRMDQQ